MGHGPPARMHEFFVPRLRPQGRREASPPHPAPRPPGRRAPAAARGAGPRAPRRPHRRRTSSSGRSATVRQAGSRACLCRCGVHGALMAPGLARTGRRSRHTEAGASTQFAACCETHRAEDCGRLGASHGEWVCGDGATFGAGDTDCHGDPSLGHPISDACLLDRTSGWPRLGVPGGVAQADLYMMSMIGVVHGRSEARFAGFRPDTGRLR